MSHQLLDESAESEPDAQLLDVLRETDLLSFERKLCHDLQLTRLEHFEHVSDDELRDLSGLSAPATRRLRAAIEERRRRSRGLLGLLVGGGGGTAKSSSSAGGRVGQQPLPPQAAAEERPTCLIGKEDVRLMEKLGEGSFAVVRRAVWSREGGRKTDVAVKLLRESSAAVVEELQQEVGHMQRLRHPNLVRLFGLVFASPVMMVVELREGGSLLERLRATEKAVPLMTALLDWATQVAKGMAYLETRRAIHRDLAARNVLLAKDERQAKIGDFGLMRALPDNDRQYVMSAQRKVPFAWCPPESLRRRQFSHASDVWSFGVTVWEIFTFGEEPWCGYRGPEILQKLMDGARLAKPVCCPSALFELVGQCWADDPQQRPRFLALKELLKELILPLAECREAQKAEGFLEMAVGDRLIVVEGSAESYYWFAQNARTRAFGKVARKALALGARGRRGRRKEISQPLAGSFIHAAHGDARGGDSWGQPAEIDAIFLRNPMPLVQLDLDSPAAAEVPLRGAEVVESIAEASRRSCPVPLRPPPPNVRPALGADLGAAAARRRAASYYAPPSQAAQTGSAGSFASDFAGGEFSGSSDSTSGSDPYAELSALRDANAANTPYPASLIRPQPVPHPQVLPPRQPYYALPPSNDPYARGYSSDTGYMPQSQSSRSDSGGIPEDPVIQQTTHTLHQEREMVRAVVNRSPVELARSGGVQQQALQTAAQNLVQRPPQQAQQAVGAMAAGRRQPAAAISQQPTTPKSPLHSALSAPDTPVKSLSNDPDPFEVPSAVKQLASRPRYSQMYTQSTDQGAQPPATITVSHSESQSAIPVFSLGAQQSPNETRPIFDVSASSHRSPLTTTFGVNPPPPMLANGQFVSQLASQLDRMTDQPRPQAVVVEGSLSARKAGIMPPPPNVTRSSHSWAHLPALAPSANSSTQRLPVAAAGYRSNYGASMVKPQSWVPLNSPVAPSTGAAYSHGGQHKVPGFATLSTSSLSRPRLNTTSTLVPQASATGVARGTLEPSTAAWRALSRSTGDVRTAASGEVLNLFDPLSNRPPADLIARVQQLAPFVSSVERCAVVLQRCGGDAEAAARELKVEKLVDMGVATDRAAAHAALAAAAWDLNAAAERCLA